MPEHFASLREALAARLERFRGTMSDDEFAQLIDDLIQTTLRFEEIDARERGSLSISGLPTYKEPETRSPA